MDLREQLRRENVADIGYREPVAVPRDATVRRAVETMQTHRVGCCCVVEGEQLAGLFTERNLIVRVLAAGRSLDTPIAECMTPSPEVARLGDPIHVVLTRLHQGGFRHLPVVDAEGRPIGTISAKRAVRFLGEHLREIVYNVAPDPGR